MELKSKAGMMTAIGLSCAAVAWMVLGGNGITVSPTNANTIPQENTLVTQTNESKLAYSVQAKTLSAQIIEVHLPLSGQTVANETLTLVNNYQGKVTKLAIEKGDEVKQNQAILSIDTRTLKSQIEQAKLLIKQRALELDGIKKLNVGNLSSKVNLAQAETDLASAKSSLKALEIDLENATLTAPFSGIVNSLEVKQGQVLSVGTQVGHLVSLNPIKISVNIPQNKIQQIQLGTLGKVTLESGYEAEGAVSFINTTANTSSRTIQVEMEVDNPDNKISSGLTASVDFILEEQKAHAFSPALLTLDDSGHTAVKIIDINNKVKIMPVVIVKSERDQIWVKGLPNNVNIITVGQGFVSEGDTVDAHYQL
ncbi:efflux RND transporter periplasmic adaptor subunit [Marinomonas posidonica]|uniref:Efflux transporter, RND family, MFP subunit n=1 Tax=Marinomonas posidonica (strain CECT 7376 / NCIMB 14433 / IVIA-Po-181) TaxID=491952 RepID=F6CZB5_MARPP|nr:efflux RND transporter periplasmic adaptor subunit [Marinomonas posidonica]AEF54652.1 efflux transporter, RND family, MFP subunit [Marinomonas posidonica IVIA-Po-181]